jgi:hypothetical protein
MLNYLIFFYERKTIMVVYSNYKNLLWNWFWKSCT